MNAIEELHQLEEINHQLIEANLKLTEQVVILTHNLSSLQDRQAFEICTYFMEQNSIHNVAKEYYFNSDLECYYALVEYFGCSAPLVNAVDYNKVFMSQKDNKIDDDEDDDDDEDHNKQ